MREPASSPALLKLQRFAAIVAYASESTDGVDLADIVEAVGSRFQTVDDMMQACSRLFALELLIAAPRAGNKGFSNKGIPDRFTGCPNGIQRLRDLRVVVNLIEMASRNGARCQVAPIRDHASHPRGWARNASILQLFALGIIDVVQDRPGLIDGRDQIKLLNG